ncbi:MAG: DEAD/DEAH box helicase family protein [Erysipelotrichaceae bacterium]|nr:DEAD/DEAH box helicase family protein [Erysipelotrichaceae bacterium]
MNRYISDEIKMDTYATWLNGKKIVINAPTGTGKTTFILTGLLPYCRSRGKKMLILCNRRLLRQQYGFELADYYDCYRELIAGVDVLTYQALAEKSSDYQAFQRMLKEYDIVICDETHYFYGDSDFNSVGTYSLLQKIILACFYKCIIMITATFSEVKPLIEKTYKKCAEKLSQNGNIGIHFSQFRYCNDIYDFQSWCDYSRLTCLYTYDVETLVEEIANSEKKTLVFIDDKQKAEAFKKMLIKTNGVKDNEVFLLNAQIMDERIHDEVIQALAVQHKVRPKIIITTSVLDNGISIHDEDVGNIVIATDSRVSFIQMVGRIRAESTRQCNLYIFPRDFRYYEKRISQYEEKMRWYEELEEGNLDLYALDLLRYGWIGKDGKAEFLRNAIVITDKSTEYYTERKSNVYIQRGEVTLAINEFAKEKTGNMLLAMKRFYKLSLQSPERVAQEQIAWLGKKPEELCVLDSSYQVKREEELKKTLLQIQEFSLEQLSKMKAQLAKEFRKDLLKDIVKKDGSFSKEKLQDICADFGLYLETTEGKDKKNRYTVKEKA